MTSSTNPLFRAASQGDVDSIKALLAEGVDINASSDRGQTALILAAFGGHSDVVSLLLAAGADPKTKDSLGLTAQDWAGRRGFPDVAEILSGIRRPGRAKVEPPTPARETIVTDPPVEELNVEFRKPNSEAAGPQQGKADTSYERSTLPGLAGAILRTKIGNGNSADVHNCRTASLSPVVVEHRPEEAAKEQQPGPPANLTEGDVLTLPSGSLTNSLETQRNTTDPLSLPVAEESESRPMSASAGASFSEEAPTSGLDDSTLADETASKGQPTDEATLPSGTRQPISTKQPVPPVRSTGRVAATQAWLEPSESPHVSHITVPTFVAVQTHNTTRPIVWGLVLVMLVISSFVSYRLSNYFFRPEPAPPNTTAAVTNASEPVKQIAKLAPVIGGALSGAELIVPDAVYPANLKPDEASGNVTVEVKVDRRRGMVTSARAVAGAQALRAAAVKAAKHAAFSPEKLIDTGRAVIGTITYNFVGSSQTGLPNATPSVTPVPEQSLLDVTGDSPVAGGPLEGTAANLPKPEYPSGIKSKGVSGRITIVVRVNRAGKVISWRSLDGDPELRKAALAAARKATFSPAKLPGDGEVVGTITYNFK
jgi:TonB family protein